MHQKSLPRRALKYALISSSIIMFLVFFSMLTRDVVGTASEIAIRILITGFGVFGSMWLVFIFYLYTNPDAETPRNKE